MIHWLWSLRQLESLVAIADGGSFSRAAITLNLAQPSLSRQMALLEQELGQRLLVRTGRGVELTSAARSSSCTRARCWTPHAGAAMPCTTWARARWAA
jgi:hypothetical protein